MSDEEDYMSDKFLEKLDDVRPSLIKDREKRRRIDIETQKKENHKRQRLNREGNRNELLQESLKKEISKDNKGFKLLEKMGYKPGQALGKQPTTTAETKAAAERLTEPLSITIRDGRSGLGRDAALRELEEKRREIREKRLMNKLGVTETVSTEDFRRRATARAEERFVETALRKCQSTCETLDNSANVLEPEMIWFWPERLSEDVEESTEASTEMEKVVSSDESVEVEVEYSSTEKLGMLISYMRIAYLFCYWCGIKYDSLEDLNSNCPGLRYEDH